MKLEPIGNLVSEVDQGDPAMLGKQWINYLDIASVDNETKRLVAPQRIASDSAPSRARQFVRANDVLVSTVRPNLNAVAIIPPAYDREVASTGFCVLRSQPKQLCPQYLFFFTQSGPFVRHLTAVATGASYPAVTDSDILDTLIPLPSLSEQQQIAAQMEQADQLRRTRRYAHELSDTFLPAAFLQLFGDPRTNPHSFPVHAAGELFDIQLGKMLDAKRITGKFLKPYVGNANVQWGRFELDNLKMMDFAPEDFNRFKLVPGDILVCEGGEVGRTAIWRGEIPDCCYQKALHRLRRRTDDILSDYFQHFMKAAVEVGLVARHTATVTIAHFTAEKFEEFPIMVPPLPLQEQFAKLVARRERLRSVQGESLRQAEHLFQSLLHRAFTTS